MYLPYVLLLPIGKRIIFHCVHTDQTAMSPLFIKIFLFIITDIFSWLNAIFIQTDFFSITTNYND